MTTRTLTKAFEARRPQATVLTPQATVLTPQELEPLPGPPLPPAPPPPPRSYWVPDIEKINKAVHTLSQTVAALGPAVRTRCGTHFNPEAEQAAVTQVQTIIDQCKAQFQFLTTSVADFKQKHGGLQPARAALQRVQQNLQAILQTFHTHTGALRAWEEHWENNQPSATHASLTDNASLADDDNLPRDSELVTLRIVGNDSDTQVLQLATSIQELHHLFLSLDQMILEQGQLVDNIDCHVAQTLAHVQGANEQLRPAERYSREAGCRMWWCLLILGCTFVGLLVGVVFKFKDQS